MTILFKICIELQKSNETLQGKAGIIITGINQFCHLVGSAPVKLQNN